MFIRLTVGSFIGLGIMEWILHLPSNKANTLAFICGLLVSLVSVKLPQRFIAHPSDRT